MSGICKEVTPKDEMQTAQDSNRCADQADKRRGRLAVTSGFQPSNLSARIHSQSDWVWRKKACVSVDHSAVSDS
jgi:hypothetical protein